MDQSNSNNYQWQENNNYYDGYNNNDYNNGYNNGYNNYSGRPPRKNGSVLMVVLLSVLCIAMIAVIVIGVLFLTGNGDTSDREDKKIVTTSEKPDSGDEYDMYIASEDDDVEFRSEPEDDEDNVIDTIAVGTRVRVIDEDEDSIYAKVRYNGEEGYVKREYLTDSKPWDKKDDEESEYGENEESEKVTQKPTQEPTISPQRTTVPTPSSNTITKYMYVANVENSIYLRSTPYEGDNVLCTIPLGAQVGYITSANATFSKIKYNGYVGYCKTKFLSNYAPSSPSSSRYMTVCNVEYAIYLRSAPVENQSNIICEIPVGSTVEFINSGNGTFYKIRWNGYVGYSKSAYLR